MRPKNKTDLHVMWAIRDIPKHFLNIKEKGFLMMLASCIGNKEDCWYAHNILCEKLSISRSTLYRLSIILQKKGYIFIDKPKARGPGNTNRYSLDYDQILNNKEPKKLSTVRVKLTHTNDPSMCQTDTVVCVKLTPSMCQTDTLHIRKKKDKKNNKKRDMRAREKIRARSLSFSDFVPSSKSQALCAEIGVEFEHELTSFKLDWQANGKTYFDPDAAFEIWIRRAKEYKLKNNPIIQTRNYPGIEQIRERQKQDIPQYPGEISQASLELRKKALQDIKSLTDKFRRT